jgi:hypothetical protein
MDIKSEQCQNQQQTSNAPPIKRWNGLNVGVKTFSALALRAVEPSLASWLDEIISSPDLHPVTVDVRAHQTSFVRLSRHDYRKAAFLDISRMPPHELHTFNLDDLLLHCAGALEQTAPVHYILHGAFCCSTLLSRYLDLIPSCFVLKEPNILLPLAGLFFPQTSGKGGISSAGDDEYRNEIFSLVMGLLGRTHPGDRAVIIKVNDMCNALGYNFLQRDPRSKALFLSTPLRTFLLSAFKYPKRLEWLRHRLRDVERHAARFPILAGVDPTILGDAEGAAYLWLLNQELCKELIAQAGPARVLPYEGGGVADAPEEAIRTVAEFFGFVLTEDEIKSIVSHPTTSLHSKLPVSRRYDAKSRKEEFEESERRFGKEVDQGLEWASRIAGLPEQSS